MILYGFYDLKSEQYMLFDFCSSDKEVVRSAERFIGGLPQNHVIKEFGRDIELRIVANIDHDQFDFSNSKVICRVDDLIDRGPGFQFVIVNKFDGRPVHLCTDEISLIKCLSQLSALFDDFPFDIYDVNKNIVTDQYLSMFLKPKGDARNDKTKNDTSQKRT